MTFLKKDNHGSEVLCQVCKDFEEAVQFMADPKVHARLNLIIFESNPIQEMKDIYHFFEEDKLTPFKTVAKWDI